MADAEKIRWARDAARAGLTLAAPPLNILDIAMLREISAALAAAERDPSPPHVIIIRGEGERAFSAGASVPDHAPETVGEMLDAFHAAIRAIPRLPSIVIASVRGHCLGGGWELASACDLVIASETATFGQPEIDLACIPPVAAALYPSIAGRHRAAEIVLLGGKFSARDAQAMGLVNAVVPDAELDAAVSCWADALCAKSRAALAIAKRALAIGAANTAEDALAACERLYLDELVQTADMSEGIRAFMEKRPPRWSDR
jgi:cyclohexa-1,5-dienecarbonyl-CoA hydratase